MERPAAGASRDLVVYGSSFIVYGLLRYLPDACRGMPALLRLEGTSEPGVCLLALAVTTGVGAFILKLDVFARKLVLFFGYLGVCFSAFLVVFYVSGGASRLETAPGLGTSSVLLPPSSWPGWGHRVLALLSPLLHVLYLTTRSVAVQFELKRARTRGLPLPSAPDTTTFGRRKRWALALAVLLCSSVSALVEVHVEAQAWPARKVWRISGTPGLKLDSVWDGPAEVTYEDGTFLIAYHPLERKKCTLRAWLEGDISSRAWLKLDVDNKNEREIGLAIGFQTGTGRTGYYESPTARLNAAANPDVAFDLTAAHFRCAVTAWQEQAELAGRSHVRAIYLVIYDDVPGQIVVSNIRFVRD